MLESTTSFRPLLPQDQNQEYFQGPSPVRIHLEHTNIAIPAPDTKQQHFVQETQQQRPAQPGYPAQDFQSHLQQQLNGTVNLNMNSATNIVAPTPTHPHQEQALQDLQQHLDWYQQNFGHSPSPVPNIQTTPAYTVSHPVITEISPNPVQAQVPPQQQYIVAMPQTPVSHHARTVPNTPQQYIHNWPSPPATDIKHIRSQSFQLDVAPMPVVFDGGQMMRPASSHSQAHNSFAQDAFNTAVNDYVYASSAYSSSNIDPTSPGAQYSGAQLPTLFEEDSACVSAQLNHYPRAMNEHTLLLQATAGASDDFNSPNFIIGGGFPGMSPHAAMMHNIGEDVNATILDTGIAPEEVDRYISEQDPESKWWSCLFNENGRSCDKWFKRKENARSHVQNHMGDRQFQCNDCGKTFVRQHDMKRHAAIHKDDRPHNCPCGSKFARHDALTRHRQRGMCSGALPGYEKSEEEKPKRGRPKKGAPDRESRAAIAAKSARARQIDREYDAMMAPILGSASMGGNTSTADSPMNYDSPNSSGVSDHSLPMTPPDTSDFDADAFINMGNVEIDYHTTTSSWRDTPPTSPVSTHAPHPHQHQMKTISPAMLSKHDSHAGTISPQPNVPSYNVAARNRGVTPDFSIVGSSPYTADHGHEMRQTSWSSIMAFHDPPVVRELEHAIAPMLQDWLSTH